MSITRSHGAFHACHFWVSSAASRSNVGHPAPSCVCDDCIDFEMGSAAHNVYPNSCSAAAGGRSMRSAEIPEWPNQTSAVRM